MSASAPESGATPTDSATLSAALDRFVDQTGVSLRQHSDRGPLLVVFLRHGGCPFCRETLARLRQARSEITAAGVGVALVHLMSDADAVSLFAKYGMTDVPRYSDPEGDLFATFGLVRGAFADIAGPRVWWRGLTATLRGHLPGMPKGDVFRLPGTILLLRGEVVRADRPETSGGQVDFVEFVRTGTG